MPSIEGAQSYVSFRRLGGAFVSIDQVVSEIERWPLDGMLGFLAALSLEAVQAGADFSNPRRQGAYLNCAIVDDFPQPLPRAFEMYAPGRVPFTGGNHLLAHEQNIAWLSHVALLYAQEGAATPQLSQELRRRVCRLLLIANDFFSEGPGAPSSLTERRAFVLNWLRHGQFNRFFEDLPATMVKLARERILMLEMLPEFFPEVETVFVEATNGVSFRRYFEILTLFVAHIYRGMAPDRRWLSKETLCAAVKAHRDEIELIFGGWIRTPEQYRRRFAEWSESRPASGYLPSFDFVPLLETPLIEARSGELICPAVPFLLAKIVDGPYFILSDYLVSPGDFQKALGLAYQKYAETLVGRLAAADEGGAWWKRHRPHASEDRELSDSYLQRGDIGIAFEHKGGRPGTDFLRGGPGHRVLGPSECVLARLDNGELVTLRDGSQGDAGFLTRGMWQQSIAGPSLVAWAEQEMGVRPKRVFPLITHLSEFRADQVSRLGYLDPLIQRVRLYPDQFWERPQWLHVSDLEELVILAEQGRLDLAALLNEKTERFPSKRFDIFLHEHFSGNFVDRTLIERAEALLQSAQSSFWSDGPELGDHGQHNTH
jgi:hypothetical protein